MKRLGPSVTKSATTAHRKKVFEKLALYGSAMMYTHAARQLPDGKWTSKLGQLEDITHTTTEAIEGGDYGEVVQYMKRPL